MAGRLVISAIALSVASAAAAQQNEPPTMFSQMAGDWDVRSRTWDGPGALPQEQPVATARRREPSGGGFLEEQLNGVLADKPFTRLATLGYNSTEGVYEYASMDTRAPQLMHYRSQTAAQHYSGTLRFSGDDFVVSEWGKWRNARFAYRVELSPVNAGRQTLKIYFRPINGPREPEFLATQYDYTRR